jgi:long-chain acyl-CoA synthetase
LRADLANFFSAAGLTLWQGYGLTETSSVICTNQGELNRAGTVGVPITGVEMAIADDGEILARAPYITKGYYKNPEATRETIDEAGWFHTGDIGVFTADGFLKVTDRKKSLFKLSNGEYIAPQPLENQIQQSALVEHALVVGSDRKFCGLLIFPNLEELQEQAKEMMLDMPLEALIKHPKIVALYQLLVDDINKGSSSWAKILRFNLINSTLTIENGMLTPTMKVMRGKVTEFFAAEIDSLYSY